MSKKATNILELIVLLAVVIGSIELLELLGLKPKLESTGWMSKSLAFFGVFLIAWAGIILHELGHLLAGLAQGFQFQLFVAGPLGIKQENDKVIWYFNKNISHYGGLAATLPKREHPSNAAKFANVILAGPLSSLVFACLCLYCSTMLSAPYDFIIAGGGMISLGLFYATTIPARTGMSFTDRKRYQRLVSKGKDRQVEMALMKSNILYVQYHNYQCIPDEDLATIASDEEPSIRFFGLSAIMAKKLERGQPIPTTLQQQYEETATQLPTTSKKLMDQELHKYRLQFPASTSIS